MPALFTGSIHYVGPVKGSINLKINISKKLWVINENTYCMDFKIEKIKNTTNNSNLYQIIFEDLDKTRLVCAYNAEHKNLIVESFYCMKIKNGNVLKGEVPIFFSSFFYKKICKKQHFGEFSSKILLFFL